METAKTSTAFVCKFFVAIRTAILLFSSGAFAQEAAVKGKLKEKYWTYHVI